MSFKSVSLREICNIDVGFPFKSKNFNLNGVGLRLVRGQNVSKGYIRWGKDTRWLDEEQVNSRMPKLSLNDVVIGMDGSLVGKNYSLLRESDLPSLLVQRVARLKAKNNNVQKYLYYLIANEKFESYIDNVKTGSTIPHISVRQLYDYKVYLPDIRIQKSISDILSSLDDKIELNQKINKNLEELAQALYKRWFVEFEFPNKDGKPYKSSGGEMIESDLGLIPKGWTTINLSELVNQKRHKTTPNKSINLIDMANMPQYSIALVGFDSGEKLQTNLFKMKEMDLLYGSIRPYLGKFGIAPFDGIRTGTIHCFNTLKDYDYSFVCGVVFSQLFNDFCNQVSHGTKMPIVKWEDFVSFKIVYDRQTSANFNDILINSFRMIVNKVNENINLAKIRDELLPRLMSGEIEVPVKD